MLESVVANGHTFEDCKEILRTSLFWVLVHLHLAFAAFSRHEIDIKLDPGFKEFYTWCKSNDIPVIIVSRWVSPALVLDLKKQIRLISGMAPLIRVVLSNLVGDEAANEIEIIANDVTVFPDGKWEIKFRHPSR